MKESLNTRWLRWSLSAIALMLAVIAVQLSVLVGSGIPTAAAQDVERKPFLDTTRQRLDLLNEQRATTAELKRILQQLQSGKTKVQVVEDSREKRPADSRRQTDRRRTAEPGKAE